MMSLTLREAVPADARLIAQLSRETFYDTFAAQNTAGNMEKFMREQFSTDQLMAEVGAPGQYFWLAFDGTKPAGYAKMREGDRYPEFGNRTSAEIARLYAVRDYIGRGVGSALMKHCLDQAKKMGKELIWLGVWEKNEPAIRFYERQGFRKFGEHIFLLGDDPQTDWLMWKDISGKLPS